MLGLRFLILLPAVCLMLGVAPGQATRDDALRRLETKHLPNAVRLHAKVISGGLPEGEAAFRELRAMGVRTVVSVDGMPPDVAAARRAGLRYVHLPHGYDGVPAERVQQLAKAVRELDGKVYLHCHHGKHRSPAAASAACIAAGMIPKPAGPAILKLAGTSPHYRGLYESVHAAAPIDPVVLDALKCDFPETTKVSPLAESMVALQQSHDRLQAIAAAGWRSPADRPGIDAAHEALMLRELFTELIRTDASNTSPAYRRYLIESEAAAEKIESVLRRGSPQTADLKGTLTTAFARMTANCQSCHEQFRDSPQQP